MKMLRLIFVLGIIFSCSKSDNKSNDIVIEEIEEEDYVEVDDPNADYHILFIGNSLTSTNNLPRIIKEQYGEIGITVSTRTIAPPGYGLEDHWNVGLIQPLISSNYYDYVIIQQGPSSQEYGRTSLIEYGGLIAELCNSNDTKLAFFMVWPSITYFNTFDGVIENYTDAASISNAILLPVGRNWKYYIDQTQDYSYYGSDGFHPSLKGSQNAAQNIMQTLALE
jgi:lysophospholipase L1-like esterase